MNNQEGNNKMGSSLKAFVIGAICMALACSVAFNMYQSGQLKSCVVMPSTMIDLKELSK